MLEHKGLYWSKVPGTEDAKTIEPAEDYILPFGKGKVIIEADKKKLKKAELYWWLPTEWEFTGLKKQQKL
jgi:hypothetical protein